MESKYFKPGTLIDITTEKSHLPFRNATILEVNDGGVVVQQKAIGENAPIRYFAWAKMEVEFVSKNPVSTMTRTSGAQIK